MQEPIHMAVTRRVRKEHTETFERMLSDFAARSLNDRGSRGVNLLYPSPGAEQIEYGILRSFASEADRDAFYSSPMYKEWEARIEAMVEGGPIYRKIDGLEAFFREPGAKMPPRWKMALLTWIAVWPVSLSVSTVLGMFLPKSLPLILRGGIGAAGIVLVLTWVAMPLLVKAAHSWLHPKSPT